MQVVVITGGIGGAKFVEGLYRLLQPEQLTVIPNVGDDDEFHGLWVSPDVDTLMYTLSGCVNRETGWGIAGDTFYAQEQLKRLGQDVWMNLGDRDLATHMVRSLRRRRGERPTDIAKHIAHSMEIGCSVLLPTDATVQTRLQTDLGELSLEEYFVKYRCRPQVSQVHYRGAESAHITTEAESALLAADLVFIAPSNPSLSIAPTLAVGGVREALQNTRAKRIAISPLIGGRAIKGPTCEVLRACGYSADAEGIARFYDGLIDTLVIDHSDESRAGTLRRRGLAVIVLNTLMGDVASRRKFANQLMQCLWLQRSFQTVVGGAQ